jgi:hypothetical protein
MRLSVFAVVLSTAAAPALAGAVITSDISTPKVSGKLVEYIELDRLRIESPDGHVTIFRADQDTAYELVPVDKKFARLTPDTIKQIAAAVDHTVAQLKSIPREQRAEVEKMMLPEQRAQVEKMMAGEMSIPLVEFRKTGGTESFGTGTCERVEVLMDGQPHASLCVVRISDLGLTEEDLGGKRRDFAFRQQGIPQIAGGPTATVDPMEPGTIDKVVGYAAYVVQAEVYAAKTRTTIKNVEKKALAADLFEVPAGYREESMPALH